MQLKSQIGRQMVFLILGQILCAAITAIVFLCIGKFEIKVILGCAAGIVVACANYFLLSFFANKAADKAQQQDVAGGQKLIQMSYMGRLIGIFAVLVLCAKSGWCNLIALVLPLALNRPILTVVELLGRKGRNSQ